MTNASHDLVFERALCNCDEEALAAECTRRLRALAFGGTLTFRCGWEQPAAWRMPVWNHQTEPPYAQWGRDAALALIAAKANRDR